MPVLLRNGALKRAIQIERYSAILISRPHETVLSKLIGKYHAFQVDETTICAVLLVENVYVNTYSITSCHLFFIRYLELDIVHISRSP